MPCYHCGARQKDPGKGPSPWKRGVVDDEQVLVCPDCQRAHDWVADLDRCASCGSTMLARALGETRCRECSWTKQVSPAAGRDADDTLSHDVAAALRRKFSS